MTDRKPLAAPIPQRIPWDPSIGVTYGRSCPAMVLSEISGIIGNLYAVAGIGERVSRGRHRATSAQYRKYERLSLGGL